MEKLTKTKKRLIVGTGVIVVTAALLFLPIVSGTSVLDSVISASSAKPDPPGYSVVLNGEQGLFSVKFDTYEPIWTSSVATGCTEKLTVTVTAGSVSVLLTPDASPGVWARVQNLGAGQSYSMDVGGTGYTVFLLGLSTVSSSTPSSGYYDISTPTCNPSSSVFCEAFNSSLLVAQESNLTPAEVTITAYVSAVNVNGPNPATLFALLGVGQTATFGLPFLGPSGPSDDLYVDPALGPGTLSFVCVQVEIV